MDLPPEDKVIEALVEGGFTEEAAQRIYAIALINADPTGILRDHQLYEILGADAVEVLHKAAHIIGTKL